MMSLPRHFLFNFLTFRKFPVCMKGNGENDTGKNNWDLIKLKQEYHQVMKMCCVGFGTGTGNEKNGTLMETLLMVMANI